MVASKHHNDGKSDLTGNGGDNGMMDSHQKTPPAAVRPGDLERQPFTSLTVGLSGRLVTLCYRWPRLGMIGLALCCRGSDGMCVPYIVLEGPRFGSTQTLILGSAILQGIGRVPNQFRARGDFFAAGVIGME